MSDTSSTQQKSYKAIAKRYKKESETATALLLKSKENEQKAYDDQEAVQFKFQKLTEEHTTLTEEHAETKNQMADFLNKMANELQEGANADDFSDEQMLDKVRQMKTQAEAGQKEADAFRMLGVLQVEFNLLQEQMETIRKEGFKVRKQGQKTKKGLSKTHRGEDVQDGVLRAFEPDRCCAVSWANGLGQQCSRHWVQNDDGDWTHMCKTHSGLCSKQEDGSIQFEGSFGVYHQPRPTKWGEHGLKVQKEYRAGGKIPWKLNAIDYDRQVEEMCLNVPADVPRFAFPELPAPSIPAPDDEFSDDEDGADDDASQISLSDSEGADDVANLEDVATEDSEIEEDEKCEKCGKTEEECDWEGDGPALTTYAVNNKMWCPDCISDDCGDGMGPLIITHDAPEDFEETEVVSPTPSSATDGTMSLDEDEVSE